MNARNFHSGMGKAVAERTILRKIPKNKTLTHIDVAINDPVHDDMKNYASVNGLTFNVHDADSITPIEWEWEDWGDVAQRVAQGNTSLVEGCGDYDELRDHIGNATILMSGRHLQHGDASQSKRNLEVFSNCSTAPASFLLFYLLLNGSGVGRSYDDDLMLVNWDHSPTVRCVLDASHADYDYVRDESLRDAQHKYGNGSNVHWFKVPDSREGWAQAVELYETMTFQKAFRDHLLILDFSDVREKGAAIGGMQGRPSSGPIPLMQALHKIGTLKGAGLAAWMQAMYVDHYLAEPVLVGGARRAARMAVKYWKDRTVIDFIHVKRPIEFKGKNYDEVQELRGPMAFLWSSNNSIGVDAEFWLRLSYGPDHQHYNAELTRHARRVFEEATGCAYGDGTGEPGFINLDELVENQTGDVNTVEVGSARYQIMDETHFLLSGVAKKHASKKYKMIVNPCGEITLSQKGAYCVISDVVPYHADTLVEAQRAFELSARALIRVNTMDSLYNFEVKRTNRIGVGITGVHEFAWKFFKVGFGHMVKPDFEGYVKLDVGGMDLTHLDVVQTLRYHTDPYVRAAAFWECLGAFSRASMRSAFAYADELGVARPHTVTTIKPAGTTSKLFGLTEGWHLSPLAYYMRYVQFREDDPLIDDYERNGYEVRSLETYRGHRIVGFPTEPVIASMGMGDDLVLAGDASPTDQYTWIKLGEFFWIEGGTAAEYVAGKAARSGEPRFGNQISYTLKYKPDVTSLDEFRRVLRENQSKVRCASVMPQADTSAYEYLPETAISKGEYEYWVQAIQLAMSEDIDAATMQCAGGACPVDIK